MPDNPDWFYLRTKKKLTELQKAVPMYHDTIQRMTKKIKSSYPLRDLGVGQERIFLSEEERENHLHIIGTTGEGKSRFIEHLIRDDIQNGNGVCFLDPTDRAETAYSVLRYCQSIGFTKVCLIDPHLRRLTCLQPFHRKSMDASVSNVWDTIKIFFSTKDDADTPRVRRYLSALLRLLWKAELTLRESIYFSDYENVDYARKRREIFNWVAAEDEEDPDLITIEGLFKNYTRWQQYFSSTINRLDPFWNSKLSLMLGADTGVDFVKMITEGWVILVNLDAEGGVDPIHTRLIGTTVINELLDAMTRLRQKGYSIPYYLYVDEAGQYVNDKLIRMLEYKRKSGFRITIAHQGFWQFPKDKADAVKQLCKNKVMFNTPGPADRLEMMKSFGYGGEITPTMAQYANKDLPKQYAIVKIGKTPPQRIKIQDVPDVKIPLKEQEEFRLKLLTNPWNKDAKEIREQFESRFSFAPPTERKGVNRKPASKPKTVWDVQRDDPTAAKNDSRQRGKKH